MLRFHRIFRYGELDCFIHTCGRKKKSIHEFSQPFHSRIGTPRKARHDVQIKSHLNNSSMQKRYSRNVVGKMGKVTWGK